MPSLIRCNGRTRNKEEETLWSYRMDQAISAVKKRWLKSESEATE